MPEQLLEARTVLGGKPNSAREMTTKSGEAKPSFQEVPIK
jgi:hypothetical protein